MWSRLKSSRHIWNVIWPLKIKIFFLKAPSSEKLPNCLKKLHRRSKQRLWLQNKRLAIFCWQRKTTNLNFVTVLINSPTCIVASKHLLLLGFKVWVLPMASKLDLNKGEFLTKQPNPNSRGLITINNNFKNLLGIFLFLCHTWNLLSFQQRS